MGSWHRAAVLPARPTVGLKVRRAIADKRTKAGAASPWKRPKNAVSSGKVFWQQTTQGYRIFASMKTAVEPTPVAVTPSSQRLPRRRRSRWRKNASRYVGYAFLRTAHAIVSRLPLRLGLFIGRLCAFGAYFCMRGARRHAYDSLYRVYGNEFSEAEIRRQVRQVFRNTIATAIEWVILRRWSNERLRAQYPEAIEVIENVRDSYRATGRGVIGLTAHFGNWEVLSLLFSRFAPGLLVPVAKRAYFGKYQEFLHRLRTEDGVEVIYNDESPRRLIRALRQGHTLGLLPDQDLRTNSGVFVEFFGKPAYTVTFPVELARRLNVPMAFCSLVREGSAASVNGFRCIFADTFEAPRTDDEEADLLRGTQHWTTILEDNIRRYPTQWIWIYPRWRSTPEKPRVHDRSRVRQAATADSA